MLGVEQHALAGAHEERDRVADHAQVLLARGAYDLLDVQHRCLAHERAHRREALGQHAQSLVAVGVDAAATRHAERDHLRGVQVLLGEQLEQSLLLGVGRRKAGLDHVHAERVQGLHHAQLLLGCEAHAASPHAVAQGRVV